MLTEGERGTKHRTITLRSEGTVYEDNQDSKGNI